MDIIFKKPSSIFVTMKVIEFIDHGIEIDCNHNEYSAKVVCKEMRKSSLLHPMNDEKTLFRFRWFDSVSNLHVRKIVFDWRNVLQFFLKIKNASIQQRYTVMRGSKNVHNVGRVVAFNGGPLKVYKNDDTCNTFNGTDTMSFSPFQLSKEILWVFSDAVCKSFPLRFKYKKMMLGLRTTYKYLSLADPLVKFWNFFFHSDHTLVIHLFRWTLYASVIHFLVVLCREQ